MDMTALHELRDRLWSAKVYKYRFAAAADYAAELEKQAGPVDFEGYKHSVDHLLALVEKAIRVYDMPKPPKMAGKPTAKDTPKMVVRPEPKAKASDSR